MTTESSKLWSCIDKYIRKDITSIDTIENKIQKLIDNSIVIKKFINTTIGINNIDDKTVDNTISEYFLPIF